MGNPLSGYGLSDADYAMTVGMVMGEALNEGLIGMGLVAATGLNRAQNPGAYLSRSAALGDVFAAPYGADAMIDATRTGRSLPGAGRQFSPTFNSNIPGASTEGHKNFKAGMEAAMLSALDPAFSPALGARQPGYERAQKAVEIAVKARDMGIDLGFGVEHFSAPGFESAAGVGRNRSRFGGHSLSPTGGWPRGVTPPTPSEFASRFAAAAALTGVSIPDEMVSDITAYVDRGQIMAAASIMQRQAQDYMSEELGYDVMPGLNYNDLVQPTGLRAVDVPDMTGQLGITPIGPQGFADHFGISPMPDIDVPFDPATADFSGVAGLVDGPAQFTGPGTLAPAGAFSGQPLGPLQGFTSPDAAALFEGMPMDEPQAFDAGWTPGFEGFHAPDLIDQAGFNDRWGAGFPDPVAMDQGTFDAIHGAAFQSPSISMDYPQADLGISPVGALGMGQAFGIQADPWSPSGFHAGVDGWSPPDAMGPHLSDFDWQGADAIQNTRDAIGVTERSLGINEGLRNGYAAATSGPFGLGGFQVSPSDVDVTGGLNAARTFSGGLGFSGLSLDPASYTPAQPKGTGYSAASDWGNLDTPREQQAMRTVTETVMRPETHTVTREVPFSQPNALQAAYEGDWADKIGVQRNFSTPTTRTVREQVTRNVPHTVTREVPVTRGFNSQAMYEGDWADKVNRSVDYAGLVESTYGMGKPLGGFMDAMVNPAIAASYGRPQSTGSLFGGFGLGSLFGGINLDGLFGGLFSVPGNGVNDGGTGNTGYGGGSLGDGSYSSHSGRNDNNPQGIL